MDNHVDRPLHGGVAGREWRRRSRRVGFGGAQAAGRTRVEEGSAPVSSDDFLLWVVLDPALGAAGLTTEYSNAAYPDGYPVIFLNPSSAIEPGLWASVAAHELAHAIQFAYRDYSGSADQWAEPWYWEASAEWSAAIARPDLAVYARSSRYYARAPHLPHWVMDEFHQYGMFVVNAALEERLVGEGAMRRVWERAAERPQDGWPSLLSDVAGVPPSAVFGQTAISYAQEQFDDAGLYEPIAADGILADGVSASVGWFGVRIYRVDEDATVEVAARSGGAILVAADDLGRTVQVEAGGALAVVGTEDADNIFELSISPPVTGGGEAGGDGRDEGSRSTRTGVSSGFGTEEPAGCGVGASAPVRVGGLPSMLLTLLGLSSRRRTDASDRGASPRTG